MAKKAPKKKVNTRLKRSARRSFAAVLMITAVIVAAIPVPEAAATAETSLLDSRATVSYAYEAPAADMPIGDINLSGPGTGTVYKAYKVTPQDSEEKRWQLDWQFQFYMQTLPANGNQGGVICKYNSSYVTETIVLDQEVPYTYKTITDADYSSFYAAHGSDGKTVSEPNKQDYLFFETYFPDEYKAFVDTYNAYKTAKTEYDQKMDKWLADGHLASDPGAPQPPVDNRYTLERTVADLSEEQRLKYYCDQNLTTDGTGYTLVPVTDRESSGVTNVTVYIPKGGQPLGGNKNDENGFMYTDSSTIVAIGDRVFAGITNVKSIELPEQMRYIGNEAFMGSFLNKINLANVEEVGNRAFKDCTQLVDLTVGSSVKKIGNEAFRGCKALMDINLPYSVTEIGHGAFSACENLKTFKATDIQTDGSSIGDYAFYNDIGLDSVDFGSSTAITKIGKAAFAIDINPTGNLKEFQYPQGIKNNDGFGDLTLAGRTNLEHVIMPANYGRIDEGAKNKIPGNTFYKCINLGCLEFPTGSGACGYASFDVDLFNTVTNKDFFVQGPETDNANEIAQPRRSTWSAKTLVSDSVPYKFMKNGMEVCELVKDGCLVTVTEDGTITGINPHPDITLGDALELEIKDKYGDIPVKELADGAVSKEIKEKLKTLTIYDDSLTTIADEVFKGCPKLEEVTVGNSVSSIGANAFADCPKLENVTFHTPTVGYEGFSIGGSAFETGSNKLTFHGDIQKGYAPFDFAVNPDNYANRGQSARICYKSLTPTNLTVILDNETGLATLIDYPHYNTIDEDNADYIDERIDYFTANSEDPAAFQDYLTDNGGYSIIKKWEAIYVDGKVPAYDFEMLSTAEEALVNATREIVVPDGVDSIDVAGFYGSNSNNGSIARYASDINSQVWDSYTKQQGSRSRSVSGSDVVPGLFSGYYQDYNDLTGQYESSENIKGNDRVEKIVLNSVKTLPDYAFDDCRRLNTVELGNGCTDIGTSPFRGCENLITLVGNDKFNCTQGVVTSTDASGKLLLETCLPARGNLIGDTEISVRTVPELAQVSEIKEGAFESCIYINTVDLSGTPQLHVVPPRCFKNCTGIADVTLPDSITRVEDKAFEGVPKFTVTVYGKEVSIRDDAFEHSGQITMRSYDDSAAERYAQTYGLNFKNIGEGWKVIFMDYDGTLLGNTQFIADGKGAEVPADPYREGYTFKGWKSSPLSDMSVNKITADVTFIAQYDANPGTNGGNGSGGTDGTGGSQSGSESESDTSGSSKNYTVTIINGSGSGTYVKDATVSITANAPATGKKFVRWETSSLNVAMANVKDKTTTFKMPANNVVITAIFDSTSGSGSSTTSSSASGSGGSNKDKTTNGSGSSGSGSGQSGSGGGAAGTTTPGASGTQSGTTVAISKPGISNTDKASASVDGSTDNFVVRITDNPEASAAVEKALTNKYGSLENILYLPMDISLYDATGSTKISDTTGLSVNITLPLPDNLIQYAGNNKAGAVTGGDTLEELPATFKTIDGVPCINFTARHFSPYTVYVDTQNLTAGMDTSPKTGDPIHPKWFLALGLACLSVVLFMKKDRKTANMLKNV